MTDSVYASDDNSADHSPIIYWFRRDLRTRDLPGLAAAVASGRPVVTCYIMDDEAEGLRKMGAASQWWLHHSLAALQADIKERGGELLLRKGHAASTLLSLAQETGAGAIYFSHLHEPGSEDLEQDIHQRGSELGLDIKRYPGTLLFEPGSILNKAGLPFKVFTPFWRHCRTHPDPPMPQPSPGHLRPHEPVAGLTLDELGLLPLAPNWAQGWENIWTPGYIGARERLDTFLADTLSDYDEGRNHPARDATSRLSAHLHFGEISTREVWHATQAAIVATPGLSDQADKFLSELGWREFSHHLLHHFPELVDQPFKAQFSAFPWLGGEKELAVWRAGQTGYPIVDAGMRELWQTGYMHNRVRMIVASFLTKHLLVHWRAGEAWFWDTLVDADVANNTGGWQWVAGSGADASPYFRIFNPVTQGQKFDGEGDYVRHWVPELSKMPNKYLHNPWEAPASVLEDSGVVLGENYPQPMVDHKAARESALAAYQSIRQ